MFRPNEIERCSMLLSPQMEALEMRIMDDIVRRLRINGEITSAADWQINRLYELGVSKRELKKIIQRTLKLDKAEISHLYKQVIRMGYARSRELYKAKGRPWIPFEDNYGLQQLIAAVAEQTDQTLQNITQSLGFAVRMPSGQLAFQPIAEYYQRTLDAAMLDISSGAFDYNTVLKRTVREMTNSGLRTVDYATGHSNRVEVAARRAVMTGLTQLTDKVTEDTARELETDMWEITWHSGFRPEHWWGGRWYSSADLVKVCGYGTVTGLCGANCYHQKFPVIPGISVPAYSQEELDRLNAEEQKPREFGGKTYTKYEALQHQRRLETTMRAQRQEIKLLQDGGAKEEDITAARARYRGTSAEYARFSEAVDLPQQRERVTVDGLGAIGVGKYTGGSDRPAMKQRVGSHITGTVSGQERAELLEHPRVKVGLTPANVNSSSIDNSAISGIIKISKAAKQDPIKWLPKSEEITSDARKRLTDYAKAHNIILTGLRRSDVDEALVRETIENAASMLKVYPELNAAPERPFTIKVVNGLEPNTFAQTTRRENQNVLQINANAFRDSAKLAEEYSKLANDKWFVKGTDYGAIIKHEIGHMYQTKHKLSDETIVDAALRVSGQPDRKSLFRFLTDTLSEYAGSYKDGSEIISEVFADYYGSKEPTAFSVAFMDALKGMR